MNNVGYMYPNKHLDKYKFYKANVLNSNTYLLRRTCVIFQTTFSKSKSCLSVNLPVNIEITQDSYVISKAVHGKCAIYNCIYN